MWASDVAEVAEHVNHAGCKGIVCNGMMGRGGSQDG
jgi:hypothetical protein